MGLLAIVAMSCSCLGVDSGDLSLHGTISKVNISGDKAVISFKGIGRASQNDPAFQNCIHPLALYDTDLHLVFGGGMHTYPRFRYLEWLNKAEAINLLKQFREENAEVSLRIKTDSILYSKLRGNLSVSRISGTLISIAEWKNLFKESISEFHKGLGVDYQSVIRAKHGAVLQPADPALSKPQGKKKSKPKSEARAQ